MSEVGVPPNFNWIGYTRLKVKLFLFVLDRPIHNLRPTQKIILCSRGEKYFLSFAAKTSDS